MNYRNFGKTGLKVSEIGFACGRVGGLLLGFDEAAKRLAVRKALEAGVNWFDTATEAALGALLAEAGADATGEARQAVEWVGKAGRARKLRDARVTAQGVTASSTTPVVSIWPAKVCASDDHRPAIDALKSMLS